MEAERRQVTVLFADMVGFTTFSERSGEEAAFTLMRSLSRLMDEAVHEQGGVVQGFTGDGIMAVFGAPVAFEDAPLRACRAALSIQKKLGTAGAELAAKHGVQPQLRIGLNTGAAVVGAVQQGVDASATVLGDTVNFASRLQALAEPNTVYVSEATHRLVQGMVEASFVGEHQIKGKSGRQKVYRLDAVRQGATRFGAAVSRGLSAFVGRERELEALERAFIKARSGLRAIDVVAEPGMGKSRLLHEFRQRIGDDRVFVLSGSCSPDAQQTAFFPFIEVVRGSFRVSAGEAEKDVAQKLEMGLTTLGLNSARNLGLLLHLLGLEAPEGALTGLDGVLIGLRTRELLHQLLEARCRLSPVFMMIEDLHWIDSASEEVLGKIVQGDAKLRLLLLTTRRPEYLPPWLDHNVVTKLVLEPLSVGHIRRLVQSRLRVDVIPEELALQATEKAEGNPLFAEEIVSYLIERGATRTAADFDHSAVAAAVPGSVQSLLTARVDRLTPKDRALLQAAAVIGRRFEPQLLAAVAGDTDIDARLGAMQALDLVRLEGKSGEYAFKHALVRDALYQSLLTEPRSALHAKIAEEIERRSGNRLVVVAEVLAHHYSQTGRADKAFAYLSLAGSKSLGVYSLDEAATHLSAAIGLIDKTPECASDDQVADFLVSYSLLLNLSVQVTRLVEVLTRYSSRVAHLGDDPRAVLIRHHFVFALYGNARFRDMAALQQETSAMADRLGGAKSRAYSLSGELLLQTVSAPKPLNEFEALKKEAIEAASGTTDAYIHGWIRFIIGWVEFHLGRMNKARDSALELMEVGQNLQDPRSTGLGLLLLTWIALVSDSYNEALEYSDQTLAVVVTPYDRLNATAVRAFALILHRRTEEGLALLNDTLRLYDERGFFVMRAAGDGLRGVGAVLQGDVAYGINLLEEAILRREQEGYRDVADWYRLFLGEIYLQIIGGNEKLPFLTLVKNLPILLSVTLTASSRIPSLMKATLDNPHLEPDGFHHGHVHLILGVLYKIKKQRNLAVQHLTEAKRILSQFGHTPIVARVETALAELGKQSPRLSSLDR